MGSQTPLAFGKGVYLKKVEEEGAFSHVIINNGVSKRLYGELIVIKGLQLTREWHGGVQVCRTLRTACFLNAK